jgi:hypothetical protein
VIEHLLRVHIALEFDDGTHAGAVGLIADIGDAGKDALLLLGELEDLFQHGGLIDLIGKLGDDDVLLAAAQVLFVTLRINWIVGLIAIIYYVVICGSIELIVYGKFFGHPDNCTANSLTKKNFPLAKKIVLARRYGYTICLGILNAVTLFAANWPTPVKYIGFTAGCLTFVFTWFFLRQRRKNISRDAVDIEKELTAKSKKAKK